MPLNAIPSLTRPGTSSALRLTNLQFNTHPLIVHAHGHHDHKPHWEPIRRAFFELEPVQLAAHPDLTIITCNNGHPSMGLFERGLDHLGLDYRVGGAGLTPWVNARDKPKAIQLLLQEVSTLYTVYADSRDALALDHPGNLIDIFETSFDADLVFGADRMHWPPVKRFKQFERQIAQDQPGDFHFLNGGLWMGRTAFCRAFFAEAAALSPISEAPTSEQGILRELFARHYPRVALDYTCRMFQNLGFVIAPIFRFDVTVRTHTGP